jgi:hypothetical protein
MPFCRAAEQAPGFDYIGCFQEPTCGEDNLARALSSIAVSSASMTVEKCAAAVAAAGYKYAAVQYGIQCYGGNDISAYVEQGTCNTPCAGNSDQICGGGCANSIYQLLLGVPQCLRQIALAKSCHRGAGAQGSWSIAS